MRKHWLDNIRWTIVVLVVIYHVIYMYNAEGIQGVLGKITNLQSQWYDVFQYALHPWFMSALFIVSGISSRLYLEQHTEREFIGSRTTKLLVPSTIGLFVFQFLQGYVNMSLGDYGGQFDGVPLLMRYFIMVLSGTGVLWYIQLLWLFSLVLVPVRRIEKDRLWNLCSRTNLVVLILLTAAVWGAAQILNTPYVVVYRFGLYGFVFFLGYFVFSHNSVIACLKKYFFLFAPLALAFCVAFCIVYFGENYALPPANRSPIFAAFCWFMCLAVLGGAARFFDFENAFTRWMKNRSWGLYIFHYLGISAVARFVAKPGVLHPALIYALSLIAGFAAGYGLNALISRLPFFRWAVLGIKKKKEAH